MLREYYLRRQLPYATREDIDRIRNQWKIRIVAIQFLAPHDLTQEEIAELQQKETVLFTFNVDGADLENASMSLDAMLLEAHEKAYDEKVAQYEHDMDRADEFSDQFEE